ncbi:MAG TPA: M23 family metallopeptidase [Pirellulaceae bacterium]|nr:M23 family metallopeptidase [Pirellulaceae bacterium]
MNERPTTSTRPTRDWWFWLAAILLLLQGTLFIVPHVAPGPLGAVCWMLGVDGACWRIAALLLLVLAVGWSLFRRPFWNRWRLAGLILIVALALSPLAFRHYPSSHTGEVSEVRFRLPLDGPITVGWGGDRLRGNYHVSYPAQRWAYDLLVAKEGKTYSGDGTKYEDYYCYGMPVLSPADGEVVAVLDGMRDTPLESPGVVLPPGGNQIVIKVAPRQYLFLCHLQRGTISVLEKDQVTQGQVLARVGNSGNTSEPHLHIHLQDTPDMSFGEGIPLYFSNYRVDGKLIERGMPTGGMSLDGPTGQIVEHAGP